MWCDSLTHFRNSHDTPNRMKKTIYLTKTSVFQAFKKVAVDKLEIINSAILSDLPSRTFYDLDIRDQFLLSNTTMKALTPNAFAMNSKSSIYI